MLRVVTFLIPSLIIVLEAADCHKRDTVGLVRRRYKAEIKAIVAIPPTSRI